MRKIVFVFAAAVLAASAVAPALAAGNGKGQGGGQKPGSGTMPPSSQKGLCQAYFSGSQTGQDHKHQAPPFKDLAAKADAANQTVAQFCGRA